MNIDKTTITMAKKRGIWIAVYPVSRDRRESAFVDPHMFDLYDSISIVMFHRILSGQDDTPLDDRLYREKFDAGYVMTSIGMIFRDSQFRHLPARLNWPVMINSEPELRGMLDRIAGWLVPESADEQVPATEVEVIAVDIFEIEADEVVIGDSPDSVEKQVDIFE